MPRPDTSKLEEALAQAFIVPVYDAPGSEDNVSFVLNVQAGQAENAMRWNSKALNQQSFWVVYLLGAFQGSEAEDNDPIPDPDKNDELPPVLGSTSTKYGGSLIFLETIEDVSRQKNIKRKELEQETVVHEVGHALARPELLIDPEKDEPVTHYDEGILGRYRSNYLDGIRRSEKPAGQVASEP